MPFTVHKDFICNKSLFFKTACSKDWKEAHERVVSLPETALAMFAAYLDWGYVGNVESGELFQRIFSDTDLAKEMDEHIEFYLLADFIQDTKLAVRIVVSLMSKLEQTKQHDSLPGVNLLKHVYDNTGIRSLLRRVLVDVAITKGERVSLVELLLGKPTGYVLEIAQKLLQERILTNYTDVRKRLAKHCEELNYD